MSNIWQKTKDFFTGGNQKENPPKPVTKDESIRELEKIQIRLKEMMEELEKVKVEEFPMSSVPEDERTKTKERLDVIKSKIGNFFMPTLKRTDSAALARLSTDKIKIVQIQDAILFFAQNLNQAINDGNIAKAEACMVGLGYGVQQAYKPIPDSNRDKLDVEMNMRFQKLEKYRGIVSLTQQIADRKNGVARLQERFDKKEAVFDDAWEIYDANRKRYPQRYQGLKNLAGTQQQALTPEQLKAYQETSYIQNTSNELKRIKKEIAAVNISIEECEHQIENLDNAAIMLSFQIDYDLQQKIEEANSTITQKTNEILSDIVASQESLDKLQAEFDEIFNASEFRGMVAKTAIEAEKIDQENEQKMAEEAAANANYLKAMQEEKDKEDKIKNEERLKAEQKIQAPPITNKRRNTNSMF